MVVPNAQAQMGDVPLPASEAIVNAGSDAGSLAALAAVPERQPSAPSPAEFFGNIAALTSGSYGGLPVPGSLAEGPDLAGPLSLDAPGVPSVGPGPMGGIRDQTGGSGYGMPEPLHMPKADAWRAFGRPGATGGAPPGGGGAQVGPRPGGHQEPGTPEYSEPANGGAARGPFGAVAGNALGGQPIDSWRAGGQQGWRSLSGEFVWHADIKAIFHAHCSLSTEGGDAARFAVTLPHLWCPRSLRMQAGVLSRL